MIVGCLAEMLLSPPYPVFSFSRARPRPSFPPASPPAAVDPRRIPSAEIRAKFSHG